MGKRVSIKDSEFCIPLYKLNNLAREFKCNFEHARRICIKLFNEGKIERTKIVEKVARPYSKYWK